MLNKKWNEVAQAEDADVSHTQPSVRRRRLLRTATTLATFSLLVVVAFATAYGDDDSGGMVFSSRPFEVQP